MQTTTTRFDFPLTLRTDGATGAAAMGGAVQALSAVAPSGLDLAVGRDAFGGRQPALVLHYGYGPAGDDILDAAAAAAGEYVAAARASAGAGLPDSPEAAAVKAAAAAEAGATARVKEVEGRLAKLRAEYEAALAAGKYPKGMKAQMVELQDELEAALRWAAGPEEDHRAAQAALRAAGDRAWRAKAAEVKADLEARREALREKLATAARLVLGELAEIDRIEQLTRG